MPELPEVEITAGLIGQAVAGARVESASAPGLNALRSVDPPLSALSGTRARGVRRRGKHLIADFDHGLSLVVHLMSAGRFQLYDRPASARDRTARILVRLEDGRELRLREFGRRQSAWAKVVGEPGLERDEALAGLGPEAWPDPPAFDTLLRAPRPLHSLLRDQRTIAGIGRSWADEILHSAGLSPFKRGDDLSAEEADRLRSATIERLGAALAHYEQVVRLPIPDKLPMPLRVHRHRGAPCFRCGTPIEAVSFDAYELCYCPACQTGGKVLKDRRLSRLLK